MVWCSCREKRLIVYECVDSALQRLPWAVPLNLRRKWPKLMNKITCDRNSIPRWLEAQECHASGGAACWKLRARLSRPDAEKIRKVVRKSANDRAADINNWVTQARGGRFLPHAWSFSQIVCSIGGNVAELAGVHCPQIRSQPDHVLS